MEIRAASPWILFNFGLPAAYAGKAMWNRRIFTKVSIGGTQLQVCQLTVLLRNSQNYLYVAVALFSKSNPNRVANPPRKVDTCTGSVTRLDLLIWRLLSRIKTSYKNLVHSRLSTQRMTFEDESTNFSANNLSQLCRRRYDTIPKNTPLTVK